MSMIKIKIILSVLVSAISIFIAAYSSINPGVLMFATEMILLLILITE